MLIFVIVVVLSERFYVAQRTTLNAQLKSSIIVLTILEFARIMGHLEVHEVDSRK